MRWSPMRPVSSRISLRTAASEAQSLGLVIFEPSTVSDKAASSALEELSSRSTAGDILRLQREVGWPLLGANVRARISPLSGMRQHRP